MERSGIWKTVGVGVASKGAEGGREGVLRKVLWRSNFRGADTEMRETLEKRF